ncbi:alkyl sulfatase C-terminal domain-containing protein, partial [Eubacteriales bacterium DFI.9.88]|nr:alkyl sulfatase C-terminal domain-containing protein [Eubacteriales bacterium DFI.9.88]
LTINLDFTDESNYLLPVKSGVVLYQKNTSSKNADATLTMPKAGMAAILGKDEAAQKKAIKITGDQDVIKQLTEHMVEFEYFFNIVEP